MYFSSLFKIMYWDGFTKKDTRKNIFMNENKKWNIAAKTNLNNKITITQQHSEISLIKSRPSKHSLKIKKHKFTRNKYSCCYLSTDQTSRFP